MDEALQRWIAAHPYLSDLARFQANVAEAVAAATAPRLVAPRLDAYAPDYERGVPLLHSAAARVDLAPAGPMLAEVSARLAAAPLPAKLGAEAAALRDQLTEPSARERALAFVRGEADPDEAPPRAGLLRFVGWTTLRAALAPLLRDYADWRERVGSLAESDPWGRGECPTCGAPPAMAQLAGDEQLRRRTLSCGCCATQWPFRRTGCPFCGNMSMDRLGALEVEGDDRLRIDTCDSCSGYLKTYAGKGEESALLADWTTLHLDVVARERGLKRVGASLYDL